MQERSNRNNRIASFVPVICFRWIECPYPVFAPLQDGGLDRRWTWSGIQPGPWWRPTDRGAGHMDNANIHDSLSHIAIWQHRHNIFRDYEWTSTCPGYITYWLLQRPPEWIVSGGNWETTTSSTCLCSYYTDSIETRPRQAHALGAALASL